MSTEIVQWQPTTLPDGWRVRSVTVDVNLDPYRWGPDRVLIVELQHIHGWEFQFETPDPAGIDEAALAALLNALASSSLGAVMRASADWNGGRW